LALHRATASGNRPEDTLGLLAAGREWLDRRGYGSAPDHVAGQVARMSALGASEKDLHEVARPFLHPSRVPPVEPAKTEEPVELPAEGEPLTERLELRVGRGELEGLKAWARQQGQPLSRLLRRAVRSEMEFDRAAARKDDELTLMRDKARRERD
jgi:hypothetical protein